MLYFINVSHDQSLLLSNDVMNYTTCTCNIISFGVWILNTPIPVNIYSTDPFVVDEYTV